MIDELADPVAASCLLIVLSQLSIVAAGLFLMISFRRIAGRLVLLGIVLAGSAVVVPSLLAR